jgi:RHS repeat-associated protein
VPTTNGTNTFTIVAKDVSGNTTTQQYELSLSGSSKTFTYDANGNLSSDGSRSLEWDAQNQMVLVAAGTYEWAFQYDGDRRRVRLTVENSGVVQSDKSAVWCQEALCEQREAASGTPLRRSFGRGEQLGSNAQLFAKDHLLSVAALTDQSGALTTRYHFDPWGRRTQSGSGSSEVGYTSHDVLDGDVFFTLNRAYDAELGRWLSQDPIGMRGGTNLYAYVENKITTLWDPLGLWPSGPGGALQLLYCMQHPEVCSPAPQDCVRRIATYTMMNYCDNGGHSMNDPSCRKAHCLTNCQIVRQCVGGRLTAVAASYKKEYDDHRRPTGDGYSFGDQCANAEGRKHGLGTANCDTACVGVECRCPGR